MCVHFRPFFYTISLRNKKWNNIMDSPNFIFRLCWFFQKKSYRFILFSVYVYPYGLLVPPSIFMTSLLCASVVGTLYTKMGASLCLSLNVKSSYFAVVVE